MNPLERMTGRWLEPGKTTMQDTLQWCPQHTEHTLCLQRQSNLHLQRGPPERRLLTAEHVRYCLFLFLTDTFSACPGMGSLLRSTRSHVSASPALHRPRQRAHGGGQAWRGVLARLPSARSAPPPLLLAVGPAEQAW